MRRLHLAAIALAVTLSASNAFSQTPSTSALNPSPIPADGVIAGRFPQGGGETTYYFAADLKAGDLATQIGFMGRPGPDKSLELTLVDTSGHRAGSYYVMGSTGANQEAARVLPVDNTGRYVLRVTTKGPETTTYRIELGGSALAGIPKAAGAEQGFSRSFLSPTPVPADGVIEGGFPPSQEGAVTYYYFTANLKAGQLLSQLSFAGRKNGQFTVDRQVDFDLFNAKGRRVGGYYIMSSLDANQEATKSIPIDATGTYVLRIGVKGPETTRFKLELGGDSLASQ
jgi:hypothetical protein